jgi:transcriptional regulator with XRE-family HTH domain
MSDVSAFGPRLRRERERRRISLETISTLTNVSVELWEGLEHNDFSRWPTGIFARAFVRDYARAIGLDADELVDDFCRLFPVGDRRASRVIRAQAVLIGHRPEYHDDAQLIPGGVDRRVETPIPVEPSQPQRVRLAPRLVAVALDTATLVGASALLTLATAMPFWPALGMTAIVYYAVGTIAAGGSPGMRLTEVLQHRMPTLFSVDHGHRAHA